MRVYKNLNPLKSGQSEDANLPILITKPGLINGDELTILTGNQKIQIAEGHERGIFMTSRQKPFVRPSPAGGWLIDIPDSNPHSG